MPSIGVSYYLIAFFDLKNVDHDGNVVGKMTGLNKGAEDGAASSGGRALPSIYAVRPK